MEETKKPVFLLWLGKYSSQVRIATLTASIEQLGGSVIPYRIGFKAEATHCVIATELAQEMKHQPPAKVVGCLATGSYIVTEDYVSRSARIGTFIGPDLIKQYEPPWTLMTRLVTDFKGGRLFKGWTATVIIKSEKQKAELEAILVGGGARVTYCSVTELLHLNPETPSFVFTQPAHLADKRFQLFYESEARKDGRFKVFSFLYIYKYAMDPHSEENLEYFEISNPRMEVFHARLTRRKSTSKKEQKMVERKDDSVPTVVKEIVTIDLTTDSSEEDSDDEVTIMRVLHDLDRHILSDDSYKQGKIATEGDSSRKDSDSGVAITGIFYTVYPEKLLSDESPSGTKRTEK